MDKLNTKQIVDNNIKKVAIWLESRIDKLNIGLNLMGVYAKINENNKNQLDFYETEGIYIGSKLYGYSSVYEGSDFGKYPNGKFISYNQVYSFDVFKSNDYNDRYLFRTYSNNGLGKGYTIEMFFNIFDTLKEMSISSYRSEDEFIIKEFTIGDGEIKAKVENAFGPSGNYEDGEEREIWYASKAPLLFMTEAVWPKYRDTFNQIQSASIEKGVISSNNIILRDIPDDKLREIMINITRHPRNKELINYVLNEYEKMIPGLRKFVADNFQMYDNVINQEYVSNPITDAMINETIMERCNFDNIKGAKSRKLTQNN